MVSSTPTGGGSLLGSGGGGGGGGASTSGLQGLSQASLGLGVVGAMLSSIGSYYSVLSQRYQVRSQALDLEFQGTMSDLSARSAELDANALLEAGAQEKGLSTLRYGQAKAESRTRTAAAGLQAGVGSAAEVQASIEAAKQLDSLTIERNTFRAIGSARSAAVNFRNRALISRVSAHNLRQFAGSVSPFLAGATSLIGGAGQVTSSFLAQQSYLQNR